MLKLYCLLLAAVLLAGACSRDKSLRCNDDGAYLGAQTAGQLRVPDDLSLPDETDALRVPGPAAPGENAADDGACLEFSPALQTGE